MSRWYARIGASVATAADARRRGRRRGRDELRRRRGRGRWRDVNGRRRRLGFRCGRRRSLGDGDRRCGDERRRGRQGRRGARAGGDRRRRRRCAPREHRRRRRARPARGCGHRGCRRWCGSRRRIRLVARWFLRRGLRSGRSRSRPRDERATGVDHAGRRRARRRGSCTERGDDREERGDAEPRHQDARGRRGMPATAGRRNHGVRTGATGGEARESFVDVSGRARAAPVHPFPPTCDRLCSQAIGIFGARSQAPGRIAALRRGARR